MFSLTSKTRYALTALLEIARHHGKGLLQVKDIAERRAISPAYLEQLMGRLVHAGILKGTRGKNGGYALAAPPDQVTVMDVLDALEGPLEIAAGFSDNDAMTGLCKDAESAVGRIFQIPLSEMARRQEALSSHLVFHI